MLLAFAAPLLTACRHRLELPNEKAHIVHPAPPDAPLTPLPAPARVWPRSPAELAVLTPVQVDTALRSGRDSAQSCVGLIDHDADEFFQCVLFKAQPAHTSNALDDVRRLGAYWYGWATADIHGAYALDGADRAARTLLGDAMSLQGSLRLGDDRLCGLVAAPCEQILNRKKELLGGSIEVPLHY